MLATRLRLTVWQGEPAKAFADLTRLKTGAKNTQGPAQWQASNPTSSHDFQVLRRLAALFARQALAQRLVQQHSAGYGHIQALDGALLGQPDREVAGFARQLP